MELTVLEAMAGLLVVAMLGYGLWWKRRRRWSARSRMKRPIRYLTLPH